MIDYLTLKNHLKGIASENNLQVNACWKRLLLERFLARLSKSDFSEKFVFKGGFLLAYLMKIGRETTDLDFLVKQIQVEEKMLEQTLLEIVSEDSVDGFSFSLNSVKELKQPHMEYKGYRVSLKANFDRIRDNIQIDVGVGDWVLPVRRSIPLMHHKGKPLYEKKASLLVYPVETVFCEKLETVLSKAAFNSRMKDYHDLLLLARTPEMIDHEQLKISAVNTFSHRGTKLSRINFRPSEFSSLQTLWKNHLKGLGESAANLNLPKEITEVVNEINKHIETLVIRVDHSETKN